MIVVPFVVIATTPLSIVLQSWDKSYLDRYGNGASIFTTSGIAARKFQTDIEAGQVTVPHNIEKKMLPFPIYICMHSCTHISHI